jgi:hypothetical protein
MARLRIVISSMVRKRVAGWPPRLDKLRSEEHVGFGQCAFAVAPGNLRRQMAPSNMLAPGGRSLRQRRELIPNYFRLKS